MDDMDQAMAGVAKHLKGFPSRYICWRACKLDCSKCLKMLMITTSFVHVRIYILHFWPRQSQGRWNS
jgi:hypothetical protein